MENGLYIATFTWVSTPYQVNKVTQEIAMYISLNDFTIDLVRNNKSKEYFVNYLLVCPPLKAKEN